MNVDEYKTVAAVFWLIAFLVALGTVGVIDWAIIRLVLYVTGGW